MNYFYLHGTDNDGGAVAYAPKEIDTTFWTSLNKYEQLPFDLVTHNGALQDYLANDRSLLLLSEKLGSLLTEYSDDKVHWVKANVIFPMSKILPYKVLCFTAEHDVLNVEKTLYTKTNGKVIKGVLSKAKIQGLHLFVLPTSHLRFIVSERVKQEIEKAGCTGVEFTKIPVA